MNKKKFDIVKILIIFIVILNTTSAMAVENYINFIGLEGEQEFSNTIVKTILQDSKGYMWFGSNDGLTKYDGYKTQKYRQAPFGYNTLLDNYITCLEEDEDGYIWIGTNKGLNKLDTKTQVFTYYTDDEKGKNKINSKKVSVVKKDKNNNMWVGTTNRGLSKYNKKEDKFISYNLELTSENITDIYEDKEGYLWIGTEDGLNRLNIETKEVTSYKYDENNENTLSDDYITAISQDMYGDIWTGTKRGGLNKINLKSGKITRYLNDESNSYSIGSNHITTIIEDKNGTLWIGTKKGGLAKYDRQKEHFVKRLSDPRNIHTNKENNIQVLYQDSTGLMWVGIEYGGINKFNPLASFQNYTSVEVFDNSMNDNNILSIYKDKEGIIWAGTENGGVNKLNLDGRSVDYYKHDPNDENTLSSNSVKYILEDSEGLMWFATEVGINILDRQTGNIKRHIKTDDETSIISNNINYIFEDLYNDVWIGTEDGLDKYDRNKEEFIHYNKENSGLSGNSITTIFEDDDKNLWIGTFHDGLNKFNRKEGTVKSYRNNPNNENTISNDQIKTIVDDNRGNLWIGTSNGLNKFNKKTEEFKVFTEKDQFKSNFISDILKHDNYLWISSNDGISKFDMKNEIVVKSYSAIDGLQGNYFNSGSSYKSKDGQLLFGGTEGFNTIYPIKEKEHYNVPNIILSTIKANDKEIDIENEEKIILSHDQNKIYFEFSVIDYKKPSNNNHYFKLEGYDKTWNDVKNKNYGTYNNLKPGNYTLKIKGFNSEGIPTKDNLKIDLTIKPPYWKTKLAYLIYFLLAVSMIFVIINYVTLLEKIINERTNELNKTNKRLLEQVNQRKKAEEVLNHTIEENEKLFEEKMEIESFRNDYFINLSHELRTPLNIIISTIQISEMYFKNDKAEIAVEKVKEHFETMRKNCYRLLKTVSNIIDVAKLESKQYELNNKLINIVYLVEDTVESTISYASENNIEIIFDTQTEEEIVNCDPVEIERVILNIMSNAIKYSKESGSIWVNIIRIKDKVEISIKDDGVGIPKSKQSIIFEKFKRANEGTNFGSGIGLSLSLLLVNMHGGKLEFSSVEGEGSEFIVKLSVYEMKDNEYDEIVDLEALEKKGMDLEIEMSEIK